MEPEESNMKRANVISLALVLAIFAGSMTRAVVAQGDGKEPETKASPWEYRVFLVDGREFRDKDDYKEVLAKADGNDFHADADFKAYVLNHLAKEGWELVQVIQPVKEKSEIVHFYLRRAKR
jgi:Domain of unknown function (DUF4177)